MRSKRPLLTRARKAAGFTQEELAYRLGVDRSTVGRWEAGETEPLPWLRPKLGNVLGVTRAALSAMLTVDEATSSPAVEVPTGLDLDEQRHLAAALEDARRYVDGSVVGYFHRRLDACMADDASHGPTTTLPAVLGILGVIEQSARDVPLDILADVLSAGARGAEFAAWLYRDMYDFERAAFWYRRGTEWAQEAGDTAAQGYIVLKRSQMAYDTRDVRRVLTLAKAAQCGPWQLPIRVRAEVTQQEALSLAMLGESLHAVERKLDDARRLIAKAPVDDQPGELGSYFTDTTLTLRSASCYTEAGKPGQAAALFGDVIASGALSRRDQGYFMARRAAALALSGEPDDAASLGLESIEVARATSSQRTVHVLVDVMHVLRPWSSRPLACALREALQPSVPLS